MGEIVNLPSEQIKEDRRLNAVIHGLFEMSVFMKGIAGGLQTSVGLLLTFLPTMRIYDFITYFTGDETVAGHRHFIRNFIINEISDFSASTQHFLAIYFLFYGLINISIAIGLARGKLWAYPAGIVFFILFIFYQVRRYFMYHSELLLFFIIFDTALIVLTWLEYKRVLKKSKI